MPPTIAVAHYPEGAGHATRMLAIAEALETAGAEILMAGGGVGAKFVTLNGYDEFEPTNVDFIDTYQGGSIIDVFTRSIPASVARFRDYREWFTENDPDVIVTDDMFAAMAASRIDVPLYVVKHDMPGLYEDSIERLGALFHTRFQLSVTREFFYPVVWPPSDLDASGATRISPIALEGKSLSSDGSDVVVVPSHYSTLDRVTTQLERQGYDVLNVGSDDWESVPSLLPYIRSADVVICSGYSTIMDAAVAGTPCIVHPETDEQEAVGGWIEQCDVTGFTVASDPLDVLDAVDSPPSAPHFENGARDVADTVLRDIEQSSAVDPDERHWPRFMTGALQGFGRRQKIVAACLVAGGLTTVGVGELTARSMFPAITTIVPTASGTISGPLLVVILALVLVASVRAVLWS